MPENGHLYHVRYDFEDGSGSVVIATTRPETIMADTGVCPPWKMNAILALWVKISLFLLLVVQYHFLQIPMLTVNLVLVPKLPLP